MCPSHSIKPGGTAVMRKNAWGDTFRLSIFIPKDLWPNSFNHHWGSLLESTIALGAETGDFLIFSSLLHCLVCTKRTLPLPLLPVPPTSPIPLFVYQHRLKDFPCVVIHCSPCSLRHSGVAGVPLWPAWPLPASSSSCLGPLGPRPPVCAPPGRRCVYSPDQAPELHAFNTAPTLWVWVECCTC